jgi:hypothetical protein
LIKKVAEQIVYSLDDGASEIKAWRKQIPFGNLMNDDAVAKKLHSRISAKLACMFTRHYANDMNLLRSDEGCLGQLAHTDLTQIALRLTPDDCMPLGSVIGVMSNTPFDLWPGAIRCFDPPADGRIFLPKRLILQPGDILIFRGDLVHAGAPFDTFNVSIHVYLDVKGVLRYENDTQPMHECEYIGKRL